LIMLFGPYLSIEVMPEEGKAGADHLGIHRRDENCRGRQIRRFVR